MISAIRSAWIWTTTVTLTIMWLPLVAVMRVFDSDPVRYRTGVWFRRLPVAITKLNRAWRLHVSGEHITNRRRPYVVVSNHQSLADIALICHLPWAMKWIAKVELFQMPVFGWMMRIAEHIPLDRNKRGEGARALLRAERYLEQKCSVMIFPEGTRSLDGRVQGFADGAFLLAIKARVPVLPIALEGSHECLRKNSRNFGEPKHMFLKALQPVDTSGMTCQDVEALRNRVRQIIIDQVARWRGVEAEAVDGLCEGPKRN